MVEGGWGSRGRGSEKCREWEDVMFGGVTGWLRGTGRGVEVGQRGYNIVDAVVVAGQPGSAIHGGSRTPCERGRCV